MKQAQKKKQNQENTPKNQENNNQEVDNQIIPKTLSTQEFRTLINDKVRNMLLRGKSKNEILRVISEEGERFGNPRTETHCYNILNQVKHELKEELTEIQGDIYSDLMSKLFYLYNRNIEDEDLKEARNCLADIAKISGLGGGNQVQINKPDEEIIISFQ